MSWEVRTGDALDRLREMPNGSVHCCITSPPYWGLRDYGSDAQLGLEPTPDLYVANLVAVFREVGRVLRDDGSLWLNLGDSYASGGMSNPSPSSTLGGGKNLGAAAYTLSRSAPPGLKAKDLVGIPWLVAFALRADGWWLRAETIWSKPNPMPESVTDRPTRAHEQVFLLTKSAHYYFDAEAIREEGQDWVGRAGTFARDGEVADHVLPGQAAAEHRGDRDDRVPAGRNKRSVWNIATAPFPGAHFAVFPPKLVEPMVLAGTSPQTCGQCGAPWARQVERKRTRDGEPLTGSWAAPEEPRKLGPTGVGHWRDETTVTTTGWEPSCDHRDDTGQAVVLDPFAGAGTTGLVALRHGRSFVGIELNESYAEMARQRIRDDQPLFNHQSEVAA